MRVVLKYTKLATLASKALQIKLIASVTVVYRTLWSMMVARHTLVTQRILSLMVCTPSSHPKKRKLLMHSCTTLDFRFTRIVAPPTPPKWKIQMRFQIQHGWLAPLTAIFSWTTHASFNKYSALIRTKCVCKIYIKRHLAWSTCKTGMIVCKLAVMQQKNFGFIAEWMKIFNSNIFSGFTIANLPWILHEIEITFAMWL